METLTKIGKHFFHYTFNNTYDCLLLMQDKQVGKLFPHKSFPTSRSFQLHFSTTCMSDAFLARPNQRREQKSKRKVAFEIFDGLKMGGLVFIAQNLRAVSEALIGLALPSSY